MTALTALPFRDALRLRRVGAGRYAAELGPAWTVGPKALGSILLVLAVRAAQEALVDAGAREVPDPLAVGAEFLRAPGIGPVALHTEVLKTGRTASVVAVRMVQADVVALAATVTAGRLPDVDPLWADLPDLPAEPPADAVDPGVGPATPGTIPGLARSCELRLDPETLAFARGEPGPPVVRGWVRPRGEDPDALFALLAGDIAPPTVFNVAGRTGWAPTVQLTALLRARPAPGWLRLESRGVAVVGGWFDEDTTVVDAAGRLVCQARQLALAPLAADA
ncbi:MAG: thioesterase family protein [Pseudonocardia sp.]